jgi:hypothetical protein
VTELRPLEERDIPRISALRRQLFRQTSQDGSLDQYYHRTFFENPWRSDAYPSWVLVGGSGEVAGFIGVIPRPCTLGAEKLTAVTTTEFMVVPEARGVSGLSLMRRALDGPQDLTVSDRCNEMARGVYEAMGGMLAAWYCSFWSVPLDGTRITFPSAVGDGPMRGLPAKVFRRAARAFDQVDARLGRRSFAASPPATADAPLALETVVSLVGKAAGASAIAPAYDIATLAWLLERLGDRRESERLITAQVTKEGVVIGWFIYLVRPDGEAQVVQLAALRSMEVRVFDHLLYHATVHGAAVLRGRMDRRFASAISERGLPLTLGQPWTVVRSRRPDLMAQFLSGTAFLSRLESEWWLSP